MAEWIFFIILSAGAIIFSLLVILPPVARSPINSAISLIAAMLFIAGIYIMLSAHLVAVLQVIVYAGAIMVLFVFVIMLLNLTPYELSSKKITFSKVLGGVSGAFILAKIIEKLYTFAPFNKKSSALSGDFGFTREVSFALFKKYLFHFELISILLLVAIVGAVVIAKRKF